MELFRTIRRRSDLWLISIVANISVSFQSRSIEPRYLQHYLTSPTRLYPDFSLTFRLYPLTPLDMNPAGRLYQVSTTLLVSFEVLDEHVFCPSAVSVGRLASPSSFRVCRKIRELAARKRSPTGACLLVLVLGSIATIQLVVSLMGVSGLKQAASVSSRVVTALGLDILASVPSLAFRYMQGESGVSNFLLYSDSR